MGANNNMELEQGDRYITKEEQMLKQLDNKKHSNKNILLAL